MVALLDLLRTFKKYFLVAIISFIVDVFSYILLLNFISPLMSSTISFTLSFIANFNLSRNFVFHRTSKFKKEIRKILIVALTALAINSILMVILLDLIESKIAARLISISIVFLFNFYARYIVYKNFLK